MLNSVSAVAAIAAAQAAASQAVVQPAPAPPQQPMDLTCFGGGTANKATAMRGYSSAHGSGMVGATSVSGSGHARTTLYGMRQQGFSDQVDLRLFNGDDRIRMPRTMLPALRGGKDGWFKLKNVVADARSIRASAAVNFANNPKIFIDRTTGTISISGKSGDYSGECQVIDASAAPKF